LSRIGLWKNQGFRTDKGPLAIDGEGSARVGRLDDVAALADRLWIPYAAHLRALSAVDFDDLLLYARELLEDTADVRKRYQALFRYLHIDEYQDTNPLQLDIVRQLCGAHNNIAVVGDDDQAIYGFRGADVHGILGFAQHFGTPQTPCTTVKLEENYRSTGNILAAANAVIKKNTQRMDKTLRTSGEAGAPVEILGLADGDAEGDAVCSRIATLVKEGAKPEDIAILYRAGPQSRVFEEGLRMRGVPYRVVGGMEFFQRKEVKDTLALMSCICRPDDELSFRRVVNLPARGLGEKAIATFVAHAKTTGRPLVDVAADVSGTTLKPAQEATLRAFALPLVAARARVLAEAYDEDKDVADTVRQAVLRASIAAVIDDEPELEAKERWRDTVDEVTNAFASFVDGLREARLSPDLEASAVALGEVGPDGPLAAFLDKLALDDKDDDDDDDEREKKGRVQLMSLHASKGLEFPYVFLVGLEEGLLPHRRVIEEGGLGVEEERRLCYVGITRARRALVITRALHRRKRHELLARRASRFLEDIPLEAQGKSADVPADPAAAFFAAMRAREVQESKKTV